VPVGQLYPTAAWPTNDVVADFHSVPLDPAFAPGIYHLQVSLAPPFSQSALTLPDGSLVNPYRPHVHLPNQCAPHRQAVRFKFGESWLLGYNAPANVVPGSLFYLTFIGLHHNHHVQVCLGASCQPVSLNETSTQLDKPKLSYRPQPKRLTPTHHWSFTFRHHRV